jgi:D-alanyl-lipoteichoic acid acyltransferase DltB (MBOAT superfamily)
MVFGSYIFLFAFLPVVVVGWWLLRPPLWRLAWLTLASYFFYCWWDWRYLPLLLMPTVVDHVIQKRLAAGAADGPRPLSRRARRSLLVTSLVVNLGLLGFFKYAGFFMDSLDGIASWFGLSHPFPVPDILLPLGISFYIFTTISATVDVYRGNVAPARSLLHYACYIALFPKLVSGPITRLSQLEPQLENIAPRLTWQLTGGGLFLIACGLFKKLLIADQLAPHVNTLFAAHDHLGLAGGWAAAVGYTLQLYFDFSGYTDVAIGVGLLLGLKLPQNFDSPYQSVSIQDFWRRWHMTLSFWLRDYLYIPLGGNRKGRLRTYLNYLITFLLGGLWHGAGWTFVLWGGMHGTGLAGQRFFEDHGWRIRWTWLSRLLTFIFVAAAWVLFRAATVGQAGDVYAAMLGLQGLDSAAQLSALIGVWFAVALAGLLVFVNVAPNTAHLEPKPNWRYATFAGLMLGAAVLAIAAPSPFLYFQF